MFSCLSMEFHAKLKFWLLSIIWVSKLLFAFPHSHSATCYCFVKQFRIWYVNNVILRKLQLIHGILLKSKCSALFDGSLQTIGMNIIIEIHSQLIVWQFTDKLILLLLYCFEWIAYLTPNKTRRIVSSTISKNYYIFINCRYSQLWLSLKELTAHTNELNCWKMVLMSANNGLWHRSNHYNWLFVRNSHGIMKKA